jgi:hypothetical protein
MTDTNPYEPPGSPLKGAHGRPRNTLWWKVFFWITLVLTLFTVLGVASIKGVSLMDYVDFALSLVAVVGLFGFAYYRPIGGVVFWRYFFYVALVEAVVYSLVFPALGVARYGDTSITYWYLFEIGYTVLILWAIYRYAYQVPIIWQGRP